LFNWSLESIINSIFLFRIFFLVRTFQYLLRIQSKVTDLSLLYLRPPFEKGWFFLLSFEFHWFSSRLWSSQFAIKSTALCFSIINCATSLLIVFFRPKNLMIDASIHDFFVLFFLQSLYFILQLVNLFIEATEIGLFAI